MVALLTVCYCYHWLLPPNYKLQIKSVLDFNSSLISSQSLYIDLWFKFWNSRVCTMFFIANIYNLSTFVFQWCSCVFFFSFPIFRKTFCSLLLWSLSEFGYQHTENMKGIHDILISSISNIVKFFEKNEKLYNMPSYAHIW